MPSIRNKKRRITRSGGQDDNDVAMTPTKKIAKAQYDSDFELEETQTKLASTETELRTPVKRERDDDGTKDVSNTHIRAETPTATIATEVHDETSVQSFEKENRMLKAKLQETETKFTDAEAAELTHRSELKATKQKLCQTKVKLLNNRSELKAAKQALVEAKTKAKKVKEKYSQKKSRLTQVKGLARQAVTQLQGQLADADKKFESTESELKSTKQVLEQKKTQLADTEKKLVTLEAKLRAVNSFASPTLNSTPPAETDADESSDSDEEEPILDPRDAWTANFVELRAFRKLKGHCRVPCKYAANPRLATWVCNHKSAYAAAKKGTSGAVKLTQERIDKLESLGFHWGRKFPDPPSWGDQFTQLAEFQKEMGHCNVPVHPTDPSALAKWVSWQRHEHKRFRQGRDSLLTLDQIEKMNQIGFKWKQTQK